MAVTETSGSASGSQGTMDMFSSLGTQIHADSLESMTYFQQLEKAKRDRERQMKRDAEDDWRFRQNMEMERRNQNLNGIGMLAEQRQAADANARLRTFRRGLAGI
jgi:hypothetical protein